MKSEIWRSFFAFAALAALYLASPDHIAAQAPPGPITGVQPVDSLPVAAKPLPPLVQPRTSIMGAWKLNPDDSDDPQKKMQESRKSQDNGGYGNRRGGGYPGGGYPGGGYPSGGGGNGGRGNQGESNGETQQLRELLNPSRTLNVADATKNVETDVFDDQTHKLAMFTDGRKLQKPKDASYQEIAAHWDGTRLVTDEKGPHGGKMSRVFELSYDGTQLFETLHLTTGRNNTPVSIRYVYDAVGPPPAATPASAPAAPAPASAPPSNPRHGDVKSPLHPR